MSTIKKVIKQETVEATVPAKKIIPVKKVVPAKAQTTVVKKVVGKAVAQAPVKKVVAKKVVAKAEKEAGVARPVGKTTGVGVHQTLAVLFKDNHMKKLTDEQLSKAYIKEFPSKANDALAQPNQFPRHRRNYNAGKFTGGEAPKRQSVQYTA